MKKEIKSLQLEKAKSHSVLLAVSKTIRDVKGLRIIRNALKERFGIELSLVFKEPDLLFFNNGMLNFLNEGGVSRILISDRPALFYFDVLEFAKRHESDVVSIIDSENLAQNWLVFIKQLVANRLSFINIIESPDISSVMLEKSTLRELQSEVDDSFGAMVKRLQGQVREAKVDESDISARSSLFVTREGLKRFGGTDKFLTSDFTFDGLSPSECRRIWSINNKLTLDDYQRNLKYKNLSKSKFVEIPGSLGIASRLMVDINPAAKHKDFTRSEANETKELNVSRCVLSMTATDLESAAAYDDSIAVFAMSNHNKAGYLASALYSVAMQTHPSVHLEIIDDVSSDNSKDLIKHAISQFDPSAFPIDFKFNVKNKGTYWIRNQIIYKHIDDSAIYLVNDSDDYSSAQRAAIQVTLLQRNPDYKIAFGDIVRVDSNHKILPLDGKVERYGTASLASLTMTHEEYGYYENIMKNADTEYIERLKHFAGKPAVHWFRYPVLFQPFDGSNLTSDIYKVTEHNGIQQQLNNRQVHVDLFRERHKRLSVAELSEVCQFDSDVPTEYKKKLKDFILI